MMPPQPPVLQFRELSIGYPRAGAPPHVVAGGLNLSLHAGELVCLLGPNGAGKSTMMRTAAGMQKALKGEVLLNGRHVNSFTKQQLARELSMVLTERVTIGMLTAYDLVALGRSPHTGWTGSLGEADHRIIEDSIRATGAAHLAHRYISELSDGERQKVMLARALAQEPRLMILDEITAFLDLPRRVEIMQILRDLAHERKRAILLSTHDLDLALTTADRIWLLPLRGQLTEGTPEDLVLTGVFGAAFSSEGVHFDEENGTFATHKKFHREILLSGEGAIARWTQKALERRGYRVSTGHAALSIHVTSLRTAGTNAWKLSHGDSSEQHSSIGSLLDALSELETRER
jgi:iron complex transport system ATP-binding protein